MGADDPVGVDVLLQHLTAVPGHYPVVLDGLVDFFYFSFCVASWIFMQEITVTDLHLEFAFLSTRTTIFSHPSTLVYCQNHKLSQTLKHTPAHIPKRKNCENSAIKNVWTYSRLWHNLPISTFLSGDRLVQTQHNPDWLCTFPRLSNYVQFSSWKPKTVGQKFQLPLTTILAFLAIHSSSVTDFPWGL